MNSDTPIIRPVHIHDVPAVARLAAQLGYPIPEDQLRKNIIRIEILPDQAVFVAEAGGEAVGLAHVAVQEDLVVAPRAELLALVVDENIRGRGLGGLLLRACEEWAAGKGVATLVVRSAMKRTRAHEFYLGHGYGLVKESKVFAKALIPE